MEKLLKVRDFAERLECSPSKAYQIIEAGEIPHVALDGGIRLEARDVERFILERKVVGPVARRQKPHLKKEKRAKS